MKIAYVIDRLQPGGAERVAVDLANMMVANKHHVSFVLLVEGGAFEKDLNDSIDTFHLNRNNKFSIKKMKELSKYLENHDIVHIHMRHVFRYVMTVKLIFPFDSKIVFHDHYGKIDIDQSVPCFMGKMLKNVDAYIGVDSRLCKWAEVKARIQKNKIWKLSNIVLPIKHIPRKPERTNIKKLVMISNFKREKNIEFGIEIIKSVSKYFSLSLDIYGKVSDENYFKEIRNLLKSYQLEDKIRLITNCNEPRKYLYRYDLAIHAAYSESGPLVLMEYLSAGLPFISYNTGEVVRIIYRDIPDMIINDFDKKKWTERVLYLLEAFPDKRMEKLKKIFNQHFSEKEYLNRCIKIYEAALGS